MTFHANGLQISVNCLADNSLEMSNFIIFSEK